MQLCAIGPSSIELDCLVISWRIYLFKRRKIVSRFKYFYILLLIAGFLLSGCMFPTVKLFTDASDPLKEFVIEGDEDGKVLMIPVYGIISDIPKQGILFSEPSMVQDIVSQLQLAEKDPEIQAVLFKIDSPGGSVTASDILYHEIKSFKERTGIKVTSVIMNVAASGGYYMALPSDLIMSHPTSMTGSVGVIFLLPKFYELMDKIGVGVSANTSGENKDMGSPFRKTTDTEEKSFKA
jgi:protease IV